MALFKKKTEKPVKPAKSDKRRKKPVVQDQSQAPVQETGRVKLGPKEKRIDLAWKVLKIPHVTEKATNLSDAGKYVFNVYSKKNKSEIKKAVENIYGVSVVKVNVINIPPKKRRLGNVSGWKEGYKKAIVQIRDGQKIEIMPR